MIPGQKQFTINREALRNQSPINNMKHLNPTRRIALLLLSLLPVGLARAAVPVITNILMVPCLTIQSDTGTTNQIQYATSLSPSNWITLTNIAVVQSPYIFVDLTATGSQRFYRVFPLIAPPGADHFNVAGLASPRTAGAAGNFTATVQDTNGNPVTGYTGTIRFSSSDPAATLPADYTFSVSDAGVHTFSATLKLAGAQIITVTDTVNSSITGTQSDIAVGPAATARLDVAGLSSSRTAGVGGYITVWARDAFGNLTPSYRGTVQFNVTDRLAVMPAAYMFSAADAGVNSFSTTLKTAGVQTITVTDTVNISITGTHNSITITPAATSILNVSGFPSPQTTGVSATFTVVAQDAFGNANPSYTGTVHLSSSDLQSIVPSDYAFFNGDAGIHTFSATLVTVGTQSLTAADSANLSITGTQSGITINP